MLSLVDIERRLAEANTKLASVNQRLLNITTVLVGAAGELKSAPDKAPHDTSVKCTMNDIGIELALNAALVVDATNRVASLEYILFGEDDAVQASINAPLNVPQPMQSTFPPNMLIGDPQYARKSDHLR